MPLRFAQGDKPGPPTALVTGGEIATTLRSREAPTSQNTYRALISACHRDSRSWISFRAGSLN